MFVTILTDMKLIIGLGNPGLEYKNTRHNVGFYVLNEYAKQKGASFQLKEKFHAAIAAFGSGDEKVFVAKPTTFYNNVGEAARALSDFYKIQPEDILIVHDELMLPFGTLRCRHGGSDAGNNGIKSLNAHVGSETHRIRVGIYNDLRGQQDDADFVLGRFSRDEQAKLDEQLLAKLCQLIDNCVEGEFEKTTHRHD